MNLTFLIGRFPPGVVGGAEIQAQAWAERLSEHHHVRVVTRRDPSSQPAHETRDGYDVIRLTPSRVPVWRSVADLGAIESTVRGFAPRPDALICFQTFISGLAGVRTQRRTGVPAIVWVRGEGEYGLRESLRARTIHPGVWARARGVLVQSESNRRRLLEALHALSPEAATRLEPRLEVVPNGLVLPEHVPAPGKCILAVGRLIANKGIDVLLEAAAGLGRPLVFAGDGPERPALESRARALGVEATFAGMVPHAELGAYYASAACVVLPARRGEGMPNALLEAMAHARPVIATPVGGISDLIQSGETGMLVPPGSVEALRSALRELLEPGGRAGAIGAAGREAVRAFEWRNVMPRFEAVLDRWVAQ